MTSTGSKISGSLTSVTARNDIGIQGSQVNGTTGVLLSAGGNLAIVEAQSTSSQASSIDVHTTGFAATVGGIPVPIPSTAGDKLSGTHETSTVSASSVNSSQGSVMITSNGTTALQGVQVNAAQGITVAGGAVAITAASRSDNQTNEHDTHGTNINATLIHDFGKGIGATMADTNTANGTGLTNTTLNARV